MVIAERQFGSTKIIIMDDCIRKGDEVHKILSTIGAKRKEERNEEHESQIY